mmetsp:Transcript_39472/g.59334  ORF Transcript_39472/g.59334 Transcript_39472/m.59334 type:complete len:267 (+) Transcript_39472:665-1465(+)
MSILLKRDDFLQRDEESDSEVLLDFCNEDIPTAGTASVANFCKDERGRALSNGSLFLGALPIETDPGVFLSSTNEEAAFDNVEGYTVGDSEVLSRMVWSFPFTSESLSFILSSSGNVAVVTAVVSATFAGFPLLLLKTKPVPPLLPPVVDPEAEAPNLKPPSSFVPLTSFPIPKLNPLDPIDEEVADAKLDIPKVKPLAPILLPPPSVVDALVSIFAFSAYPGLFVSHASQLVDVFLFSTIQTSHFQDPSSVANMFPHPSPLVLGS